MDDRSETVSKKVRDAEREWVPFIVVVGDREMKAKRIPVRVRGRKAVRKLTVKELTGHIKEETEGMPFRRLPLSRLLSLRPIFVGA